MDVTEANNIMDRPPTTDTCITLEIPEGADLPLYPAGFWVRSLAYTIDWLVRVAVVLVLSFALGSSGIGRAFGLIAYFLLEWFYPVAFEVWRNGQTVGKQVMRLRVLHDDGTPITFAASLIRNLLRVVDLLPLFYVTGIICSVCNRRFKRVGDLAAGTLVVYAHQQVEPPQLTEAGTRPLPEGLNTDEQRVLLAYAQRSTTMTAARQQELAEMLTPLLGAEQPVTAIKQMANHIVGRK